MTFYGSKGTSSQFDTWWRGNTNLLVVKNFTTQDEGTYFCISYTNQVLHFSSGQPTFFPVATKAAPTTLATTTPSSQATKKDNSQQSPDAGTNSKNTLHFCYDVVMRVNLAGACLLLLTAITITITHCQRTSKEITQNSICNVFLWVRVAGTCFLILTAMTITIMHCQRTKLTVNKQRCIAAQQKAHRRPPQASH
eukprot:XP_025005892.1 T-cell surface glycoprotein CD8 alpha chain-like isoform X3 [Gallus gallus]